MNARITPNRYELPTNNTHEVFSSASKRAHELPPKDLLKDILKYILKDRGTRWRAQHAPSWIGGDSHED